MFGLLLTGADAAAGKNTSWPLMIIVYVLIFAAFYFLIFRGPKKERERQKNMFDAMEIGDTIVTTSGFYGVLIDIQEEDVIVEFGNNKNCRIPMKKSAIAQLEKLEEALAEEKAAKDSEKKA